MGSGAATLMKVKWRGLTGVAGSIEAGPPSKTGQNGRDEWRRGGVLHLTQGTVFAC